MSASPIAREEPGEQGLHRLRGRSHPEQSGLAALEGPRPLAERLGVRQQAAAPLEQILALRGELDAAPDPVEEPHPQLRLQRVNLP